MCSIVARRRHSWRAAGCATGHAWRCFHAIHGHKPSGRGAVILMMEMCQERTIYYLSALFLAVFTIHCCCCSRNGQNLSKADFKSHPKADFSLTFFSYNANECILFAELGAYDESTGFSVNSAPNPPVSIQDHTEFCTTWVKFSSEIKQPISYLKTSPRFFNY